MSPAPANAILERIACRVSGVEAPCRGVIGRDPMLGAGDEGAVGFDARHLSTGACLEWLACDDGVAPSVMPCRSRSFL